MAQAVRLRRISGGLTAKLALVEDAAEAPGAVIAQGFAAKGVFAPQDVAAAWRGTDVNALGCTRSVASRSASAVTGIGPTIGRGIRSPGVIPSVRCPASMIAVKHAL